MSCAPLRAELAQCLLRTDCVLKDRRTPQDCLQNHLQSLPDECRHLYKAYVECRRGLLDMRKRMRGNLPVSGRSAHPPQAPGSNETVSSGEETAATATERAEMGQSRSDRGR